MMSTEQERQEWRELAERMYSRGSQAKADPQTLHLMAQAIKTLLREVEQLQASVAAREKYMNPHVLEALREGRLYG
jgi:hypothetical protein